MLLLRGAKGVLHIKSINRKWRMVMGTVTQAIHAVMFWSSWVEEEIISFSVQLSKYRFVLVGRGNVDRNLGPREGKSVR